MEAAPYDGLHVIDDTEKEAVISGRHQSHYYAPAGTQSNVQGLSPKKRICGLSQAVFWLAVAMTVLAVLLIGLGAGLGVALGKANASNNATTPSSPAAVSSSATPTTAAATTTTITTTTASTTAASSSTTTPPPSTTTTTLPKPSNICPAANNTLTTPAVPLGTVRYRIACDADFNGQDTLSSFVAATWDACLTLCNTMNYFQSRTDVAATWNVAGTGQQTPGTCWCLGGKGKTVVRNVGNVVGVPE